MPKHNKIMPDRDEETGRYTGEYSTVDFLDAISAEGGLAGTGEIADRVECAHDTAYKRLQKMEEDGLISSQKMGNTLLWKKETGESDE
jgi:Mn-dependent DtxR family transcriptional regulator